MKREMLPLNLTIRQPQRADLSRMAPVTSLEFFESPGGPLHDEGLFSSRIFGQVGTPERDTRLGYISLKLPIFHPVVYNQMVRLKSLYKGILTGKLHAVFNEEEKDFVVADEFTGNTGYAFFLKHFPNLHPAKNKSTTRSLRIDLLEKYREEAFIEHLLVLPAGLREIEVEPSGRVQLDEVNELYQGVLIQSRNIPDNLKPTDDLAPYDQIRSNMTLKVIEIYDLLENVLSGKRGSIQNRWASRRIHDGTRNVISSLDTSASDLDKPNRPKFNNVVVGLFQTARGALPRTTYHIRNSVFGQKFATLNEMVSLVDPKTLKSVEVELTSEMADYWTTDEGIARLVESLRTTARRDRPVMVDGHYLALIYLDKNQGFRVLNSIDELPEGASKNDVHPVTYIELIYIAGLELWPELAAFVTRYPVENTFSSVPTKVYVKTTNVGELRYPLDENFNVIEGAAPALEFPILDDSDPSYHDSVSVNPSLLAPLGADFDGDKVSVLILYSNDSIREVDEYFTKRKAYTSPRGDLAFSANIHTVNLAMVYMTGDAAQ